MADYQALFSTPVDDAAINGFDGAVLAMVVQPDGKTIVGGQFDYYNGSYCPNRIARLNRNGSLDRSFWKGADTLARPLMPGKVRALALQSDGKILVGGILGSVGGSALSTFNGKACPNGIWRLDSDGALDTTFNPNQVGVGANEDIYFNYYEVSALAIQADNKIVVGGWFDQYNGKNVSHNIIRLNDSGRIDSSFQSGVGIGMESNFNAVNALAILDYGGILVGGRFDYYNANLCPSGLVRLKPDGSFDSYFNSTIYFKGVSLNKKSGTVFALAVQPDNKKILVGGTFNQYNGFACPSGVIRIGVNGALDATFNPRGSGTAKAGDSGTILALALQRDGRIVIGGNFTVYNNSEVISKNIMRLKPDGSMDQMFNVGQGTKPLAGADMTVLTLAIEKDGYILLGGTFVKYNASNDYPGHLLRLRANGNPTQQKFINVELRNNIATSVITNRSPPTTLYRFSTNGFEGNYYKDCLGAELWHNQHIVRLANKVDETGMTHAYFMVAQSKEHKGYISLIETGLYIEPKTDQIFTSPNSVVGKIIWQQIFDDNNEVGNWNHPGRMELSGGMLVVAAQNWFSPLCSPNNVLGNSPDAVLFYDVRDSAAPKYLGKITASEFGIPKKDAYGDMNRKQEISAVSLIQTVDNTYFLNVSGNGVYKTFKCNMPTGISWAIKDWQEVGLALNSGEHGQVFTIKETPTSEQRVVYFDSHAQSRFEFLYYKYNQDSKQFSDNGITIDNIYLPGASRDWDADGIYVPSSGVPIIYTVKSGTGSDIQIYQVVQNQP